MLINRQIDANNSAKRFKNLGEFVYLIYIIYSFKDKSSLVLRTIISIQNKIL